jgi:ankyrin repeat protein
MTPLLTAAMVGNAHAARALLAHGAQLECADDRGQTPMNWAVRNDRLEVYEVLRQAGASMDAVDTAGDTPRSMARGRIKAHMECAQMERDTDEPEVRGRIGPRL